MKVVTLSTSQFNARCRELANKISGECLPFDAIVGIASGGVFVSEAMYRAVPNLAGEIFSVKASRPSTKHKTNLIAAILRNLPHCITNRLRILEAKILAKRCRHTKANVAVEIPNTFADFLKSSPRSILLVDDAVDSGNSMKSCVDAILAIKPELAITTAAVTVTTLSPEILPDYYLFNNQTLIRFPWSKDAKKQ